MEDREYWELWVEHVRRGMRDLEKERDEKRRRLEGELDEYDLGRILVGYRHDKVTLHPELRRNKQADDWAFAAAVERELIEAKRRHDDRWIRRDEKDG